MATKNARSTFGCTPLTPECGISIIWCGFWNVPDFFESHVSPTVTKNSTNEVIVRSSSRNVRSRRGHDDVESGSFRCVAPDDSVRLEADPSVKDPKGSGADLTRSSHGSTDTGLSTDTRLSSGMLSTSLQCNLRYRDVPVVFAEMNQMYGRVGIKLERSGSSESAINGNSLSSVQSCYASPIGTRCASFDNSNFILNPNIASMNGSFKIVVTDIIVTQEGDAHLLRLQQACQNQMKPELLEVTYDESHDDALCAAILAAGERELQISKLDDILLTDDEDIVLRHKITKKNSFLDKKSSRRQSMKIAALDLQSDLKSRVKDAELPPSKNALISYAASMSSTLIPIPTATTLAALSALYRNPSREGVHTPNSTITLTPLTSPSIVSPPISTHCSFNVTHGTTEGDVKLVDISIAYSEVLQLQGKAVDAVIVVETLLKSLKTGQEVLSRNTSFSSTNPEYNSDLDLCRNGMDNSRNGLDNRSISSSATHATCQVNQRLSLSPHIDRLSGSVSGPTSTLPGALLVLPCIPTAESDTITKEQFWYQTNVAVCHRRLGVLYKAVGRLVEAEESIKNYIALKEEMGGGGGVISEMDVKRDIANAYSLLAAVIDQNGGRIEEAVAADTFAIELMALLQLKAATVV